MTWSTHNVNIASKDMYNDVMETREDLFPKQIILFQIAAAVGIKEDEPKRLEGESDTIFKSSSPAFDPDGVLESLMIEESPAASEKERLEELEKYAEGGIEIIHDKIKKTGTFDIENYID